MFRYFLSFVRRYSLTPSTVDGALEQVCFSEPWTEQGLRESFARSEYLFVTATEDDQVVGYAGLYQVLDEGDITNIAVLPSAREKGIGTVLTRALIEAGEQRAIHAFTLEVRVGNAAAIHIYEKLGFVPAGVRKGFYEKPKEDALIMWRRQMSAQ